MDVVLTLLLIVVEAKGRRFLKNLAVWLAYSRKKQEQELT
jgi:hypothetical protein